MRAFLNRGRKKGKDEKEEKTEEKKEEKKEKKKEPKPPKEKEKDKEKDKESNKEKDKEKEKEKDKDREKRSNKKKEEPEASPMQTEPPALEKPQAAEKDDKDSDTAEKPDRESKDKKGHKSRKNKNQGRQERGKNIFSASIDLHEKFQTPQFPKDDKAIDFIDSALEENFIFASLSQKERRLLIDAMQLDIVAAGTVIIKQGETGDYFYVLEEGQVSFAVDGTHVGLGAPGCSFGELALLYNCPRAATALANTACRIWKVDQKTFRYMLANNTNAQQKDINDVLRKVPFLADLEDRDLLRISDALTSATFADGERIIKKGDVGEVFYIIREGTAKVHDIGFGDSAYVDQEIGPGDFFGERALITGDPRMANVSAISSCTCLCLSRDTFELVLGPLQGLIDSAMKKRTLLGVQLFSDSKFQPHELARLTELIREHTFATGTVLAEAGKPFPHNLFIIRTGNVDLTREDGTVTTLNPADYFGDKYLKEEEGFISPVTIVCKNDAQCGVISRKDVKSVIGSMKRLGQPMTIQTDNLDKTIKFKDLVKFRILGVGTFGKVWLVSHKRTGTPYALKMLSKREIIGHHQVEGVMREKNLMASLDHPFVVNLVSTFQDDRHLYMLIALVQGGELFSVIHTETRDGIPNGNSRFYAACILESLAHLHHRCIAYRDLKPENILIDGHGYCVLVDLGFAKIVIDKTFTLCGTPEYLAPEIILSKGHDKGVDYWAFGVLIYEMVVGRSPFYSYGTDQVSLFKRIVQVKYSFPNGVVHELAQDLIQRLIVRRQANRLGCLSRGDCDVRDHVWFKIINVDKLLRKQIPPPWRPRIKDPLDATHFDSYRHLENEPPSQKPQLTAVQQEQFKGF